MKINKKLILISTALLAVSPIAAAPLTLKLHKKIIKNTQNSESLIYSDPRSSLTVFGTFGEQLTKEGIA